MIVMERHVVETAADRTYDYWDEDTYPIKCVANAGGEHIDPRGLTGVQVEAVLAIRRKWLNP